MTSGSVAGVGESPRIRGARGCGVPRVAAWVLEEHADAIYSGGSWGVKGGSRSLPVLKTVPPSPSFGAKREAVAGGGGG